MSNTNTATTDKKTCYGSMKCAIAKQNPVLVEQAVKHYQHTAKTFTFISLYDDEEPYPLNELIEVLSSKIEETKARLSYWESLGRENETLSILLYSEKARLKLLKKVQKHAGKAEKGKKDTG